MDNCCKNRFRPIHIVGMVLAGLAMAVLFAFLFGYVVMLLWNWLMPGLFGLKAVTYWQAAGLVLLARLLIGSPGHGGHGRHGHGPHRGHFHHAGRCHFHHGRGWEHYGDWWKSEGRQAFEAYVDRARSKEEPKAGEE